MIVTNMQKTWSRRRREIRNLRVVEGGRVRVLVGETGLDVVKQCPLYITVS